MVAYNPLAFGCSLRTHRIKLGWSANQLSELYAEFVGREDSPPNPAFIYHIERGTTIVSQERRAILASLVGMPLVDTTQQDSSTPLDSEDCIDSLVQIHTRLKNTSYGNDPDIGRLAVKIHQMKYPELFL